jgi:FADH2 O2-dependent halogenase
MTPLRKYDVLILGSGIGGSMLGAILAKHGAKVLILEAETHPRFTIGEATTPDTNFRLKLLGLRYGVPEIVNLSAFHQLRDAVSPSSGVKRAFSFLYQRPGKDLNPHETHQYPTLAPPMGPDCHLFRQDTDAYMLAVALQYGAEVRQQTRVTGIDLGEDEIRLKSAKGEEFLGKYLVDATGFKSAMAEKLQLRDDVTRHRTNSRAIFTHMVGVKHYDNLVNPARKHGLKYPLSQSTLHHVFEGGWCWVIPFNNHRESTNPLCSVGLVLNREIHPETGKDAEVEFREYIAQFPEMATQFEDAKAIRNWTSTSRLQYGAKNISGHRYCLLSHAAGFVDPLFSSGLVMTTAMVDMLAKQLLQCIATDNFSEDQFVHIDRFFQDSMHRFDEVVSSSFVSFRDFDLWDAWFRVWVVGLLIGTTLNANLYLKYLETKDKSVLGWSESKPYTGVLGLEFRPFREVYDRALLEMDAVRDGRQEPSHAAASIRAMMKNLSYVPTYFKWHDRQTRTTPAFTVGGITRMYFWYRLFAPREIWKPLFDWSPLTAYGYVLSTLWADWRLARRRSRSFARDTFKAWNRDFVPDKGESPKKSRQAQIELPKRQKDRSELHISGEAGY